MNDEEIRDVIEEICFIFEKSEEAYFRIIANITKGEDPNPIDEMDFIEGTDALLIRGKELLAYLEINKPSYPEIPMLRDIISSIEEDVEDLDVE